MSKKNQCSTPEKYFARRRRRIKVMLIFYIAYLLSILASAHWIVTYHDGLFFLDNSAWYMLAAFICLLLLLLFNIPNIFLRKDRAHKEFYSLWVSLVYDRLPKSLKGLISRYGSAQAEASPEEAMLRLYKISFTIEFVLLGAFAILWVIAIYLQNS